MRRVILSVICVVAVGFLSSCPVKPELSSPQRTVKRGPREYIRSFGGRGMEPGKFLSIGGIAAANGVVAVADSGLSRVQLFDYEGNFIRAIGSGIKLEGVVPSLQESYERREESEEQVFPSAVIEALGEHTFFRAKDVALFSGEVFVLNDLYSRVDRDKAMLDPRIIRFDADGNYLGDLRIPAIAPNFIDVDEGSYRLVFSDTLNNSVSLMDVLSEEMVFATQRYAHSDMVDLFFKMEGVTDTERQSRIYREWTGAGSAADQFDYPTGVAIYQDKVLAVDRFNSRIKIYSDDGRLVSIVDGQPPGRPRIFEDPVDIAVSPQGAVFLSDPSPVVGGVLVLSPRFQPRYVISHPEMKAPGYLALSSEGYLLATDSRTQEVFMFLPREYEQVLNPEGIHPVNGASREDASLEAGD